MIRMHSEERSLLSWLETQEQVHRLWIEEALAAAPADGRTIAELERHHHWLSAQIARLEQHGAAA